MATARWTFRGRTYELRPDVPLEHLDLLLEIQRLARSPGRPEIGEWFRRWARAREALVEAAPRYMLPVKGRIRRALWSKGLHPNPFRQATEPELGQLIGFLLDQR